MTRESWRGHEIQIDDAVETPAPGRFTFFSWLGSLFAVRANAQNPDHPDLYIDGQPVPYLITEDGYQIYYLPPASTLMQAAKNYVETKRPSPIGRTQP